MLAQLTDAEGINAPEFLQGKAAGSDPEAQNTDVVLDQDGPAAVLSRRLPLDDGVDLVIG